MSVKISLFSGVNDTLPQLLEASQKQLDLLFSTFVENNTTEFIGGYFNKPYRQSENLEARTLITLDIDRYNGNLTDLEVFFKSNFSNYAYYTYSTKSHTPNKPRIRFILLVEKPLSPTEYKTVTTNLIKKYNLEKFVDIEASTSAIHLMAMPKIPNKEYTPWYYINSGEYIPLDFTPIQNKNIKKLTFKELDEKKIIAVLKQYPAESLDYNDWLEVGQALHWQYQGQDRGRIIFNKWSAKDKVRYKEKVCNDKYKSFKLNREKTITFATINKKVKEENYFKLNFDEELKNLTFDYDNEKLEFVLKEISKQDSISKEKNLKIVKEKTGISLKSLRIQTTTVSPANINTIPTSLWEDVIGENCRPLFSDENFKILLDYYKIEIRFDVILKINLISENGILIKNNNSAYNRIENLCSKNNLTIQQVKQTINRFANNNQCNTFKEWVESKPWDKTDRFKKFIDCIIVEPEYVKVRNIYLKKWLLQLVHVTCLNDAPVAKMGRMVLIFQSSAQSKSKTSWCKKLVPEHMVDDYILVGESLDTTDSMSVKKHTSKVVSELGEITSTFKISDINKMKNFLSNTKDSLNIKYKPDHEEYRRRTVFFGTTNEVGFLRDMTGSSRYLVLPIVEIKPHKVDMQQLYAQLMEEGKSDPIGYYLTEEDIKLQTEINSQFEIENPMSDIFEKYFDIENKDRSLKLKVIEILEIIKWDNTTKLKKNANELVKILKKKNYYRCSEKNVWHLPPLRTLKLEDGSTF